ncbi:MAG: FAD-dependent oxidoreductase [Pseudomonadota bacterium]
MRRDLDRLATEHFDLLVVGAGGHGVFAAADASRRGLRVALVDAGDIGGATTGNSLRTMHGGVRYLQYLQLGRTLESIREQALLRAMAPDYTEALPFLMPSSGWGLRGPLGLFAGLNIHQALRLATTHGINGGQHLPRSRVLSRTRYTERVPGIDVEHLSGGALWHEVQLLDSGALCVALAQEAARQGACVANYVRVDALNYQGERCRGARCTDVLTGAALNIEAAHTLNAAGPWATDFYTATAPVKPLPVALNDSMNVLLRERLFEGQAVAIPSSRRVEGEAVAAANRMYFAVPWRGRTVVGTVQERWVDGPTCVRDHPHHLAAFLADLNGAMPAAGLTADDVAHVYWGRVPTEDAPTETGELRRNAREVIDHRERDGVGGLHTIVGVKLTTARAVAEQAIDAVVQESDRAFVAGDTAALRLPPPPQDLSRPSAEAFAARAALRERLELAQREEMVLCRDDFLLRRTDLGVLGSWAELSAAARELIAATLPEGPAPLVHSHP